MSGLLHPVGPEATQTYWLRRALVFGAFLVIVAIVIALVVNSGSSTQAVPAAPTSVSASPSSSAPGTAASTASSTGQSGRATPSAARTSAKATPKGVKSSAAGPNPTKAAQPTAVQPISCNPAELRATLTGKKELEPKQDNTFTLSLINAAKTTCVATVNASTFELKIYSGKDRIWSTADCATLVKPVRAILGSEKAIEWTMTWNGQRSLKECKNRPETPKTGTYFATAQLRGAKPVQLRMIIQN